MLAIKIRGTSAEMALEIGNLSSLFAMFADDLNIFIDNANEAFSAIQEIITDFEKLSGLTVNYDKSTVYRLGSARNSNAKYYAGRKFHWSEGSTEILGILIQEADHLLIEKNIEPVFEKIESILEVWNYEVCPC